MSEIVIGIDSSCTSTGIAIIKDGDLIHTSLIQPPKKLMGAERLKFIYDAAVATLERYSDSEIHTTTTLVIEGYAMGANGQITSLAEVGGVIRLAAAQRRIPVVTIAPASNKLRFSGYGKSDKSAMCVEAKRRFPDAVITTDDVADAIGLACTDLNDLPTKKKKKTKTKKVPVLAGKV